MTEAAPDGWFERLAGRSAALVNSANRTSWITLLRLVEVVGVVGVTLSLHGFWTSPVALSILLAISSTAWLSWLVLSWRSHRHEDGGVRRRTMPRTQFALLIVVVAASGAAQPLHSGGLVIVLTITGTLGAGAELPLSYAVIVCVAAIVAMESSASVVALSTSAMFGLALVPLVALLFGLARRERHAVLEQARALFEQTNLTRAEQQRAGALAERTRIAREIHDVLAHSLGALAIQLELAEVLLTENGDVPQAVGRIRQSRELTDQGLTETRRAVRALRVDAPPLPEALAGLAAAPHGEGRRPVAFVTVGQPRPLTPEINLALVRTAQEALFNAGKHAPNHAVSMRLEYTQEETLLTVTDQVEPGTPGGIGRGAVPRGIDGGYGLAGLRERLALAGGSLVAGPSGDPAAPGWTVKARVPA